MKKILILVILSISFACMSQTVTKRDTCFTQGEVVKIANKMLEYQHNDSTKTIILNEQSYQIAQYKMLRENDSLIMNSYQQQISLLNERVDIYKQFQRDTKKRWYDSKVIWYFAGVGTMVLTSYVLSNVVEYY